LSINDLQTSASKVQVKRGYFAEFLKKKRATILVLRVELPVNSKNESPQKTILSVQKISTNHTEIRPREIECSHPACRRPGFVIFVGSFQFGNLRLFFIQKMNCLRLFSFADAASRKYRIAFQVSPAFGGAEIFCLSGVLLRGNSRIELLG
jgi:hypothetical protein